MKAPARSGGAAWVPLVVAALLTTAACGSSNDNGSAAETAGVKSKGSTVQITLSDDGCEPRSISTKAGPVTFKVINDGSNGSASVTEFEVLDGKQILGEVENIIPGTDRSFVLTLQAGKYTTACPNGQKFDTGTVEVVGAAQAASGDAAARRRAVSTYLTFVKTNATKFEAAVRPFAAAVRAGDVEQARKLFAATREPYENIEPIAESFGDLDPSIDAREGDVPGAKWTGFHRIEKAAWAGAGSLSGMAPVATQLQSDAARLTHEVGALRLEPAQIANGAVGLLDEVSVSKITGEEDRYSHTDLSDFAANVDGAKAAFTALRPLLDAKSKDLVADIDERFAAVSRALRRHAGSGPYGNGYALYGTLTRADTRALAAVVDALAEPLSRVAAAVT